MKKTSEFARAGDAIEHLNQLAEDGATVEVLDAATDGDERPSIAKWMENARKAAEADEAEEANETSPTDEPAEEAFPRRFVIYKGPGAFKSLTLRATEQRHDPGTGRMYQVPGVVITGQRYHADPAIWVFDVDGVEAVRRQSYAVAAEEVSRMVRKTRYFKTGVIETWEMYLDRRKRQRLDAEKAEAERKRIEEEMAARRAKLGVTDEETL